MGTKIYTGLDIIKGKTFTNPMLSGSMMFDFTPWHMIPETQKTEDWIRYVANYYEMIGWNQVLVKHKRYHKNRMLVSGVMDMTDYSVDPSENEFAELVFSLNKGVNTDPLKQYYPIIPNAISILVGESLQKDNRVIAKAVDNYSKEERLDFKDQKLKEIFKQIALNTRTKALIEQGYLEDPNNEEAMRIMQEEMQIAQKMADVEASYKTFKTVGEQFAQHVVTINREQFRIDEWEKEGFKEMLTNAEVGYVIDMKEDRPDFKMVDNAYSFGHKSPYIRDYHKGDYYGYFEFASVGEIINQYGDHPDMKEENLNKLKDVLDKFASAVLMPDHLRAFQGAYYDTNIKYNQQKPVNRGYQESVAEYGVRNYLGQDKNGVPTDQLLNIQSNSGDPRLFRIMRLFFRSQRKIGWLVKKDRTGMTVFQDWVDETFEVTVEPEYDNSILKEKSARTLLYGEHVEWTWSNQWRELVKISHNLDHSYWKSVQDEQQFESIILGGKACKFQFKGVENINDINPPFVAREFKPFGGYRVSLAERMKPWQIGTNVCFNRTLKIMAEDRGKVLVLPKHTIPRDYVEGNMDPVEAYLENVRENRIVETSYTKEMLAGLGNSVPMTPSMLNLSSIDEAQMYFQLGQGMKEEALQSVGISRQRLGQAKPYETAGGIDSGIKFSETQTLEYFNDFFVEFMPEVHQRLLEAVQYYVSTDKMSDVEYLNKDEFISYMEIAKDKILHRHYNVLCTAKPRTKAIETRLKEMLLNDNTLNIDPIVRAEGILAETTSEYLEKLRRWTDERKEEEARRFDEQQKTQRQQIETEAALEKERMDRDDANKQLDRESNERKAMFTALARNKDATTDINASINQGVQNALKEREIEAGIENNNAKASNQRQKDINDALLKNKELDVKLQTKKIDKEIAEENKTQAELRRNKK